MKGRIGDRALENCIKPEFLDIINTAICQAIHRHIGKKAAEFFREVGELHLNEVLKRELVKIELNDKPMDVLSKIAKYLESEGYMEKITIEKLSRNEAILKMHGVSVLRSSARMIREHKQPSHFMTNVMLASLRRIGIDAAVEDTEIDEENGYVEEHWKM